MKSMLKLGIAVAVAAVVLGGAAQAQAKGKPPSSSGSNCIDSGSDINVTSIIADADDSGRPFQVQSDASGAYVSYKSGGDELTSVVQGSGWCDWELGTASSVSRGISVTLAYPTSTAWPAPPFVGPEIVAAARIISKCWHNPENVPAGQTHGISMGSMTYVGQVLRCPFLLRMDYPDGNIYYLRIDPSESPLSDWIEITCTGAGTDGFCNAWTVKPQSGQVNPTTGQMAAVGELIQRSSARGKTIDTSLGYYHTSFSITVIK